MPNETYLDLYTLLVVDIFGIEYYALFIFMSYMFIAFLAAKFRFPNMVTLAVFALYAIILSGIFQSVLAITLVLIGSVFSFALGKLIGNRT